MELMVKAFDGIELRVAKDLASNPKAVVVITHGICEHLNRYDYMKDLLIASNISVYRYDLRGHGKSTGKRVYCNAYTDFVSDLDLILEMAKAENPTLPVFIIGHSLGGFITACYATTHPGKMNGVILSGALTRYTSQTFGPLPTAMPDDQYFPNALGDGVCSDPKVIEAYVKDPLVEKEISAGIFNRCADGLAFLLDNPTVFTDPTLILHGACDKLIAEKDSRVLFEEIGSTDKSLHIYGNLCHEIFNEVEKDTVIGDVIAWILKKS